MTLEDTIVRLAAEHEQRMAAICLGRPIPRQCKERTR